MELKGKLCNPSLRNLELLIFLTFGWVSCLCLPVRGWPVLFCRDIIQFRPLATAVRCEMMAPRTWRAGRGRWAPRQVIFLALFPLFLQPCSYRYLNWTSGDRRCLDSSGNTGAEPSCCCSLETLAGGIRSSFVKAVVHSMSICALSWFRKGCSPWSLAPGAACCTEPFPSLCLLMADPAVLLWLQGVQSLSYCWAVAFHPLSFFKKLTFFTVILVWYCCLAIPPVKTTKQSPSLPAAFTYCKLSQSSSLGWESFVACIFKNHYNLFFLFFLLGSGSKTLLVL